MNTFSRHFMTDRAQSYSRGRPDEDSDKIRELNKSLHILATIFPDILPEVLREALQAFSGDSRLQIAVDQLLRNQDRWVRGRWRSRGETHVHHLSETPVTGEEEFRRAGYKWAVYASLCQEFKTLNKSAIKAVLAEENHCYTQARVTLRKLVAKSWRNTLSEIWTKFRKPVEKDKSHPMLIWKVGDPGSSYPGFPSLRETGDAELDMELHYTVLTPYLENLRQKQECRDGDIATNLNRAEAEAADSLFECQCCFTETTFEQLGSCSTNAHFICHQCIFRASGEALFGQGWTRNVDHSRGLLRCLSLSSGEEECNGCIPSHMTETALRQKSRNGAEMWQQFESRLTEEALQKARLPTVKCPFCPYAEVDELYTPAPTITYKPNFIHPKSTLILTLLVLNFLPLLFLYALLSHLIPTSTPRLPPLRAMLSTSLARLVRRTHRPLRFHCRSPTCSQPSCLHCSKVWHDPHICFESAAVSLRSAIESARTAALKRTCPRCGLAFIKDSGCNKLTCVCGYSMCYVCRQGLGRGDGGSGDGYRHFCQHFRPLGGECRECERCDLYKDVDDVDVVLHAGIEAEKEWREREGMVGVTGIGGSNGVGAQINGVQDGGKTSGRWDLQGLMDWLVNELVSC